MTTLVHSVDPALVRLLGDTLDRPGAGTGLQASVWLAGEPVANLAVGTTIGDEPMDTTHLHSGFCITKPLLGLAAALLIERGHIDLGTPVAEVVGPRPWIPSGVDVSDVISHNAGLLRPFGFEWRLCPAAQREHFLDGIENEPGPAYSELAAGLVIEGLIAATTGERPQEFIEREILSPLGVVADVIIDPSLAVSESVRSRVRVPIGGLPKRSIPLLSERLTSQLAEMRPAFGSVVSMHGVGTIAAALERVLAGHGHAGLPTPDTLAAVIASRSGPRADRSMRRTCEFVLMSQTRLREHHISNVASERALGHVAGIANCVMIADPHTGVALAAYLNGSTLGDPGRAEATRLELVDGLIALVAGGGTT